MSKRVSIDALWHSMPTSRRVFRADQISGFRKRRRRYLGHAIAPGTRLTSAVRLPLNSFSIYAAMPIRLLCARIAAVAEQICAIPPSSRKSLRANPQYWLTRNRIRGDGAAIKMHSPIAKATQMKTRVRPAAASPSEPPKAESQAA